MVTCKWEEAGFRSVATAILNGGRDFRVKVGPRSHPIDVGERV